MTIMMGLGELLVGLAGTALTVTSSRAQTSKVRRLLGWLGGGASVRGDTRSWHTRRGGIADVTRAAPIVFAR
jgi:hypothetical protein